MNHLYGKYDVWYEETVCGILQVFPSGLFTVFDCHISVNTTIPLRLFCSSGDNSVSIGIMIPSADDFVLTKQFSQTSLTELGLNEIQTCICLPAESTSPLSYKKNSDETNAIRPWEPIYAPASLFSDADIQEACTGVSGALVMYDKDYTFLAVPLDSHSPFPMMPIFCFGDSIFIGKKEYVMFRIRNGILC